MTPPAAQRPLRRAKGFRPTGLGPAGRNCARSPHAATGGAAHPCPLAAPGPTLGLRPLREPGEEDREKGRARHIGARSRGPRLRHAGARAPLQKRTRAGKLQDWGSPTGRGGAEGVSRGSGLSSGAVSQVLLDLSGPNRPLQSCHAAVTTLCFCVEWTL